MGHPPFVSLGLRWATRPTSKCCVLTCRVSVLDVHCVCVHCRLPSNAFQASQETTVVTLVGLVCNSALLVAVGPRPVSYTHLDVYKRQAEAMVLDTALPDLEVGEFARQMRSRHPVMDLLRVDQGVEETGARSPRRNELLHALRRAQEDARGAGEMAAWASAPVAPPQISVAERLAPGDERAAAALEVGEMLRMRGSGSAAAARNGQEPGATAGDSVGAGGVVSRVRSIALPEMVGESAGMVELAWMVRLVAPRSTAVLIEGDTGTGKELVAKAAASSSVWPWTMTLARTARGG